MATQQKIEFKINSVQDRANMVYALAFAGYKCWVEKRANGTFGLNDTDLWVIVELAPALPEEDKCEVSEKDLLKMLGDEFEVTKPDGKKLKIKVVEKQ